MQNEMSSKEITDNEINKAISRIQSKCQVKGKTECDSYRHICQTLFASILAKRMEDIISD